MFTVYNGKKQTPVPVVMWKGKKLSNNKDFEVVEYLAKKSDKTAFVGKADERTTETLTLKGKGNFTGAKTIQLIIGQKAGKENGEQAGVQDIQSSKLTVTYAKALPWKEGGVKQEGILVTYGKNAVAYNAENPEEGEYTVSYKNNEAVGTATLIITGTGKDTNNDKLAYIGSKTITFKITGIAMSKVVVEGVDKSYTYTGEEIEPMEAEKVKIYLPKTNATAEVILEKGDYTVDYQKNQNKGTATILLTGKADKGYTGTKKLSFKIQQESIETIQETGSQRFLITIVDSAKKTDETNVVKMPFTKGGVRPEIEVRDAVSGKLLRPQTDYTVAYKNNTKLANTTELKKAPTLTVSGKGNYTGKRELYFEIIPKDLSVEPNQDDVTIVTGDMTESKKAGGWKASFKVTDVNGGTLNARDAKLNEAEYTIAELPENMEQPENKEQLLQWMNEKVNLNRKDIKAVLPAGTKVQIKVSMCEDGNYRGFVTTTYRIIKTGHDIKSARIVIADQFYTGQPVEILDNSFFVKEKTYLQLKAPEKKKMDLYLVAEEGKEANIEVVPGSYIKNVEKGTAKVTFRGMGELGGTKTVTFKIGQRSIADHFNAIFQGIANFIAE